MTASRICVLGAGAAGLCAARQCHEAGLDVVVYEQQHALGGTWVYSDEVNVFSSLYETMNTNLPKEIMCFENFPFEDSDPVSFVPHQKVLAYLERYAEPIRHRIKFNTTVTRVERMDDKWIVSTTSSKTPLSLNGNGADSGKKEVVDEFDAVFVCNGHFAQPRIPQFAHKLTIPWLHCHNYRRPQGYAGKKVAIVGAGPSGCDIAMQISRHANEVHLLYDQKIEFGLAENVITHPRLGDVVDEGKALLLEDGKKLAHLDAVIFCTGYRYELPFFDVDEKPLLEVKQDGRYIGNLYQHLVHPSYPRSLFVVGLNWSLIPFVLFDHQVRYAVALITGAAPIPPKAELENFEQRRLKELEEHNYPIEYYHRMNSGQWTYFALLSSLTGRPHTLRPVIEKIYNHVEQQRRKNLTTYKSRCYRIIDDNNFETELLGTCVYD